MLAYRHAKYIANGFIDCEIDHPSYGWIPTTLSAAEPSTDLAALFEQIVANGDAAVFVPPTDQHLKAQALECGIAQIDAERDRLRYAPINYGEALFDAGADSQALISGTLARLARGDGLPVPWVGWRDHSNAHHWTSDGAETVASHLRGLSSNIENREAAIRVASWKKKAEVAALDTIASLEAYSVQTGWPDIHLT